MDELANSLTQLTTNEVAQEPWEHILNMFKLSTDETLIITADEIKSAKSSWKGDKKCQFEPRLLAYQSSDEERPNVFKTNELYMLPIKNGTYLLQKTPIYKTLDYSMCTEIQTISTDTSSEILKIGTSETSVIDNLRYSGVFERPEILGEPITHGPLLNGRHRCNFAMKLGDKTFTISGVQYEADSCFESAHKVIIIEGKSATKPINSFNMRQLYFPYRTIYELIGTKKEIIPLFIHNFKGIIHIWKYSFPEYDRMDSIRLEAHYAYKFTDS